MDENRQDSDQRNIRILIADDRPQVRESLQALLETEDGLLVVGHARDGREAVNLCATLAPGVVLMDLEMPGLDGLAATRCLRSRANCPAIVILTIHADPWWQDQASRAGASAFVSKTDHPARIIQAIRQAAATSVSAARPETCYTR
ncbi:MAG: response regulator transcription factor [Chloroflexota bacterium]|nr:response regulator transcription factor [Chloroflexota bacterium]